MAERNMQLWSLQKNSKRSIFFYIGSITACPSSGWGRLAQSRVERNGLTGIRASEGVQTALPAHTLGVLLHLQSGVLLHLLIGAPLQIGVLRRLLIGF